MRNRTIRCLSLFYRMLANYRRCCIISMVATLFLFVAAVAGAVIGLSLSLFVFYLIHVIDLIKKKIHELL